MQRIYIKPNSKTQQSATTLASAVQQIIHRLHLHETEEYSQYWNLFFESGCQYVERLKLPPYVTQRILQKPESGFWKWLLTIWVQNDRDLLFYYPNNLTRKRYLQCKNYLINNKQPDWLPKKEEKACTNQSK